MENTKEQILSIINKASLPADDVNLWEQVLNKIPDELCPDLLRFLEIMPENISYLTDNMKKKKQALENQDENSWDKILSEQKDFLQSLAPDIKL